MLIIGCQWREIDVNPIILDKAIARESQNVRVGQGDVAAVFEMIRHLGLVDDGLGGFPPLVKVVLDPVRIIPNKPVMAWRTAACPSSAG